MTQKAITILQIGSQNWGTKFKIPEWLTWCFTPPEALAELVQVQHKGNFSAILLMTDAGLTDLSDLRALSKPYALLYDAEIDPKLALKQLLAAYLAVPVNVKQPQELIRRLSLSFFDYQSGVKLGIQSIAVSPSFKGTRRFQGHHHLTLHGPFGDDFQPLLSWQKSLYADPYRRLQLWFEFEKSTSCQIKLILYNTPNGATDASQKSWVFDEMALQKQVLIEGTNQDHGGSFLNAVLWVKGKGCLEIGDLHFRWTRYQFGDFILGGHATALPNRQEILSYFDPGDFKPPLNIYFSGYRSLEGFEGYPMMHRLGAPFMLLSDPRLEGGAFYLGDAVYEAKVVQLIEEKLKQLHFSKQQLLLSGISMGAFAALYYGSWLQPHGIILGKPLINVGTVAVNNRLLRPQAFDTSLDILKAQIGQASPKGAVQLNQRIWRRLKQADFTKTKLAIAYMKNDDYDRQAFSQLRAYFQAQKVDLIGKGWVGRHNDNNDAIISWFLAQYRDFLQRDFGRIGP